VNQSTSQHICSYLIDVYLLNFVKTRRASPKDSMPWKCLGKSFAESKETISEFLVRDFKPLSTMCLLAEIAAASSLTRSGVIYCSAGVDSMLGPRGLEKLFVDIISQ
jgi:hypothetical protein